MTLDSFVFYEKLTSVFGVFSNLRTDFFLDLVCYFITNLLKKVLLILKINFSSFEKSLDDSGQFLDLNSGRPIYDINLCDKQNQSKKLFS